MNDQYQIIVKYFHVNIDNYFGTLLGEMYILRQFKKQNRLIIDDKFFS